MFTKSLKEKTKRLMLVCFAWRHNNIFCSMSLISIKIISDTVQETVFKTDIGFHGCDGVSWIDTASLCFTSGTINSTNQKWHNNVCFIVFFRPNLVDLPYVRIYNLGYLIRILTGQERQTNEVPDFKSIFISFDHTQYIFCHPFFLLQPSKSINPTKGWTFLDP